MFPSFCPATSAWRHEPAVPKRSTLSWVIYALFCKHCPQARTLLDSVVPPIQFSTRNSIAAPYVSPYGSIGKEHCCLSFFPHYQPLQRATLAIARLIDFARIVQHTSMGQPASGFRAGLVGGGN